jgi:hypothetical protein
MSSITPLTAQQLRKAAGLQEKIEALQKELGKVLGVGLSVSAAEPAAPGRPRRRKKRRLSPEGLAAIRAGVAKRMARKKRKISAAGRKALSLAAKARWAKAKAAGKTKL